MLPAYCKDVIKIGCDLSKMKLKIEEKLPHYKRRIYFIERFTV